VVRGVESADVAGREPGRRHVAPLKRPELRGLARGLAESFVEHRLSQHAAAVAFRILVSFVPLVLLALGLLGALGLEDVWTDSIAPAVEDRVTAPVYTAIDFSVDRILSTTSAGLIAFASLLLLWELSRGVRSVMVALNEIHDVDESRSVWRLLATTLVLGLVIGLCIVASVMAVVVLPRLAGGIARVALTLAAYAIAIVLLGLVVALLVRYAPAEHPSPEWASAGGAIVVAFWLGASVLFGWWAGSVASYESGVGTLTFFLVLTAYAFTSAAIFLVGAEVDERARKASARRR
jgi:membrane protein